MATVTTASIITKIRGLIKDLQKTDGRDAHEYDSDSSFKLSEDYVDSSSIVVYQNGIELDDADWSYNSNTNKVTISFTTSGDSLTKGDNIIITYDYYARYSDSEIQSYIKSNLLKFTQKRYKKTFYMNSSNEIVTLDGNNPTEEEGNIIALVTAIDIDPNNVRVVIPGHFTTDPEETLSKSEQIDKIFDDFCRTFGTIDFLEEED